MWGRYWKNRTSLNQPWGLEPMETGEYGVKHGHYMCDLLPRALPHGKTAVSLMEVRQQKHIQLLVTYGVNGTFCVQPCLRSYVHYVVRHVKIQTESLIADHLAGLGLGFRLKGLMKEPSFASWGLWDSESLHFDLLCRLQ